MKLSLAMLTISAALGACGKDKAAAPPPAAQGPVQVGVITIAAQPVTLTRELPGRTSALRIAEVRARVNGIVQKRLFTEGGDLKAGQVLFVIDPAPYQAALDSAQAQLARAEASVGSAQSLADRYATLIQSNAISRQEHDDATSRLKIAQADAAAARAAVKTAQINLGYTSVAAPIAGRIGRANVSVGNFVGPATGSLATIVSQDPIYVNFPVTQREILAYRKEKSSPAEVVVYLQLADGSRYAHSGKINFLDVTVNQGTDTVLVRASFPNPDRALVDGQLVAVVLEGGTAEHALVVPAQALQIDQAGPFVLVVDEESKIQVRRVEIGSPRGTNMILKSGLKAGDRVVSEGIQRVRPGQVVTATEMKPPGA